MFSKLYDLIVYVTNNYSSMPSEFKQAFPEKDCVKLRLFVSNIENFEWNDEQ